MSRHWRCFVLPVLLAFINCGDAGQPTSPPGRATFIIEVLGSEAAIGMYKVSGENLVRGDTATRLVSLVPWPAQASMTYTLVSHQGDQIKSRVSVAPFVCKAIPDFTAKIAQGWIMREFHQIFLNPSGGLDVDTDFEQPLNHLCDVSRLGDGRSGEGVATVTSAPARCSDPSRLNTKVEMTGILAGASFTRAPEICLLMLDNADQGNITLQFSTPVGQSDVGVVLKHCVSPGEAYPLVLTLETLGCGFKALADSFEAPAGKRRFHVTRARWTIGTAQLSKGGRAIGTVDVDFVEGADNLHITGTYDLPVLRVPVFPP